MVKGADRASWRALAIGALIAILTFAVSLAVVQSIAIYIVGPPQVSQADGDWLMAVNDVRLSEIQLLGGIVVSLGLWFTARTYLLTRQSQLVDRFSKAIEHISNKESIAARSGGVYSLLLMATDRPEYWTVVEEVLASMIRERASGSVVEADVQAALTVLGKRPTRLPGQKGRPIYLKDVKLPGANLVQCNLERVVLEKADLSHANLTDARLKRTILDDAQLSGANMSSADLTDASLRGAILERANFYEASLRGAILEGANFNEAKLSSADLEDSLLKGAKNLTTKQLESASGKPSELP